MPPLLSWSTLQTLPKFVNRVAVEEALPKLRPQVQQSGFFEVQRFLYPEAVKELKRECLKMHAQKKGFRSFDSHNIWLEDVTKSDDVKSDNISSASTRSASSSSPSASSSSSTPTFKISLDQMTHSSKTLFNMQVIEEQNSASKLLQLFKHPLLRELLQVGFQKELFPSADPLGGVYYNIFEEKDQLGWHFDRSEFSVNLILQEPDEGMGGKFRYFPDSREDFDVGGKSGQGNAVELDVNRLIEPNLTPGSLYLFAGNRSLHEVEALKGGRPRVNAIFTYNTNPGEVLNEYTRQQFFGG